MAWDELRKGRYSQSQGEYFITFNCHDKKILFDDFDLAHLFCKQLAVNQTKFKCVWLAWVLMPDHFHGLLQLGESSGSLSQVIGGLKGASAHAINRKLTIKGKLWQTAFYDRALRREDGRKDIARYIVANPLRKGLVNAIGHYPYWNSVYL